MTDINPTSTALRVWPALTDKSVAEKAPAAEAGASQVDFQELLTTLVIGMSMQGMSLGSAPGTASGASAGPLSADLFGMGSLMAPLMLNLIEQLMAQETQSQEQQVEEKTVTAGGPVPQGLPIQGRLTQASHNGHIALDFGAPVGTTVKTTMDGKVVHAGWNNEGYGNLVIVENGPYRTYYAHLSKIPVELGQQVRSGETVGLSGNTGNSTGPHLHYEVRQNGRQLNPAEFTGGSIR